MTESAIADLDDLHHHECSDRRPTHQVAEGAQPPSPRDWGNAIDHIVWLNGHWWAVAGAAGPEYSTPVRYCPWCGQRLAAPAGET